MGAHRYVVHRGACHSFQVHVIEVILQHLGVGHGSPAVLQVRGLETRRHWIGITARPQGSGCRHPRKAGFAQSVLAKSECHTASAHRTSISLPRPLLSCPLLCSCLSCSFSAFVPYQTSNYHTGDHVPNKDSFARIHLQILREYRNS